MSVASIIAGKGTAVRGAAPTRATAPIKAALPVVQRDSLRVAAIDIGSNSLHMIVAQADADGAITTLWRMKEMVGLGRISFPRKRLTKEAMNRAASALARFQQAANQRQCEKILAVATSAIRESTNGGDFIERVKRELKLPVKVVSAREEARLIYLAVRHAMPLGEDNHLIIDIGGGSVEFIVGDERKAALLESRKLGAARMTAQHVKSDPISAADRRTLERAFDRELTPLVEQIKELAPVKVVGTSGTLENIAAMCEAISGKDEAPERQGPRIIEREVFGKLLVQLLQMTSKERAKLRGLDDARKDQIVAGAILVGELFKRLDVSQIQLCESAMREGILLDYLNRHMPDLDIRREVPDPRRRSVIDLARRCHWHRVHSEQVARMATLLFDELRAFHGMGAIERELIEYAALLHDIGWHIGRVDHHKHSAYLILNGDLRDFTQQEVAVIANIARYHRKGKPKKRHKRYAALSASDRRLVDVGAAILRVADGLDRSHSSVVQGLRVRLDKARKGEREKLRVVLNARSDAELEVWGARRKRKLLEQVFGHGVVFELAKR